MSVSQIPDFNVKTGNWSAYTERLEMYFLVNNIENRVQITDSYHINGEDAYDLLSSLASPLKPAEMTFNRAVELLAAHLQPTPSVLAESSSDTECCECSQCTYSLENSHNAYGQYMRNSHHVPMYTTMAHPLIYYAQVQPLYKRQYKDQPKKENPFKKAFRWYTQERTICCQKDVAPEKCGFASWLDNKYSEYLRENGQQPQTATTSINKTCECPKPKPKRRLKSPWRKRPCQAGDVPQNQKCADGSCQYILKPKDLSRAASENMYHSPTSGEKSIDTMESSNMPCNAKYSRRSQSLSELGHENYVHKNVETGICVCAQEHKPYASSKKKETDFERPQEQVPEAVQVPSIQQDARNQPKTSCACPNEKVPVPPSTFQEEKIPVTCCPCQKQEILEPVNIPEPVKVPEPENVPEPIKVPSKISSENKPEAPCTCQQKNKTEIVKVPSKAHISEVAPCTCSHERAPVIEKLPSKVKDSENQPIKSCKCSQDKIAVVVKVPSKVEDTRKPEAVAPCKCSQEKVPAVENLPSRVQEPMNESELKKASETASLAPSKPQEPSLERKPSYKYDKQEVQKVPQVPSKDQDTKDQPGYCCSCHVKKVPEVVQVPSQCRAVQESCQCPEIKIVAVCEGTQCESTPESIRPQNLGPCCCKICTNPVTPPAPLPLQPPIFCIPVQVQSTKISSPETCLKVAPSVQCCVSPKKLKKVKQLTVANQCGEGIKSKIDSQCQHQSEPSETKTQCQYETCVCLKNKPSSNNCHEVSQVFGPIPIKRESRSTIAVNQQTGEYSIMKEVAVVNKFTRCVTCASNDAAQTSDHSIRFEKDGACSCPYPLFFKIICADIVKNE